MKTLLKIIITIVIILILGMIVYPYRQIISVYLQRILPAKPCTQPIGYTLNTFDNRFGISKADFLNALSSAEAIWEKPFGKDLFTYAPQGGSLKINLVYDYRQQATSKLKGLGIIVKDDQASYDSLKLKYNALKVGNAIVKLSREQEMSQMMASYSEDTSLYPQNPRRLDHYF